MVIGERLRLLREGRGLSQWDIEERTGLKRCYISRIENGHTVPSVETLEKMARAFDVPLYRLFYEGEEPPNVLRFPKPNDGLTWGSSGEEAIYLSKLCKLLPRIEERNRNLLLDTLRKMTGPKRNKPNGQ
jgi:transcriptional regulator with XRE-family HTH domain